MFSRIMEHRKQPCILNHTLLSCSNDSDACNRIVKLLQLLHLCCQTSSTCYTARLCMTPCNIQPCVVMTRTKAVAMKTRVLQAGALIRNMTCGLIQFTIISLRRSIPLRLVISTRGKEARLLRYRFIGPGNLTKVPSYLLQHQLSR